LAQVAIGITDTLMVGRLGAEPLAGMVLGAQLFFGLYLFGSGFTYGVLPLAANAVGARDSRALRRSIRMGLWVLMAFSALGLPVLYFSTPIFLALGQDPDVVAIAAAYLRITCLALPLGMIFMVLRAYLSALEAARAVLYASIAGALINVVLNYMLIFGNWGAPALGVEGAAIASVGTHGMMLAVALWVVLRRTDAAEHALFARLWRADWEYFWKVLTLGAPIGATLLAEVGLFSGSAIVMGWIGTLELAAHGIALQIISVLFMLPYGLSQACTVRFGLWDGSGPGAGAAMRRIAVLALGITLALSLAAALLFWVLPEPLVRLFLDASDPETPQVIAIGVMLLLVAAAFQLADSVQVVSAGLLRGLKDTTWPMVYAIISYWAIGLPAAYVISIPMGFGPPGVWAGLALGLTVAAATLTHRLWVRLRVFP
ncbi:MAG: MATE family efflux transporter, partial [Pseudomonadota bacterium]